MTVVHLLFVVAAIHLQPHDIKSVFLHGLEEEVYMEPPPRFVAQGSLGFVSCIALSMVSSNHHVLGLEN